MPDEPEPLASLLLRYRHDDRDSAGDGRVARVSFAEAIRRGDDPLHVLPYLAGLGLAIETLDDLMLINADDGEEELHSFRVAEGVAVSVASEGAWLLFQP